MRCYGGMRCRTRRQPTALLGLGEALKAKGCLEEAVKYEQESLELAPCGSPQRTTIWASSCGGWMFPQQAAQYFSKAVKADPECADAYTNLGFFLHIQNRVEDAAKFYRKALEFEPDQEKCTMEPGDLPVAGRPRRGSTGVVSAIARRSGRHLGEMLRLSQFVAVRKTFPGGDQALKSAWRWIPTPCLPGTAFALRSTIGPPRSTTWQGFAWAKARPAKRSACGSPPLPCGRRRHRSITIRPGSWADLARCGDSQRESGGELPCGR